MNVSLTPEIEQLVAEKVKSGLYQTASEVVREALRLLQRQQDEREAWKQVEAKLLEAFEDGEFRVADPGMMDRLRKRIAEA